MLVFSGFGDRHRGATAVPVHALAGAEPGASLPVAFAAFPADWSGSD
jgi:hypothetical protein